MGYIIRNELYNYTSRQLRSYDIIKVDVFDIKESVSIDSRLFEIATLRVITKGYVKDQCNDVLEVLWDE